MGLCDAGYGMTPGTLSRRVRAGGKSVGVDGRGELRPSDVIGEVATAAVRTPMVGAGAAGGAGDG